MGLNIEVRRERLSVTQGYADVYVNGVRVISFDDKIRLIPDGEAWYGERISGWASPVPDEAYIKGLLFHPLDDIYHYSSIVKNMLDASIEEAKRKRERNFYDNIRIRR